MGAAHTYASFGKTSDFRNVSGAQIFLTVDENVNSLNDAGLAASANPNSMNFIDYCGKLHCGGCGFSFCDGHAEIHRWKGTAINYPPGGQHFAVTGADINDWTYLANAASKKL